MPRSSSGSNRVIKHTIKNKVQQCHIHPSKGIYGQSGELTTSPTMHHTSLNLIPDLCQCKLHVINLTSNNSSLVQNYAV